MKYWFETSNMLLSIKDIKKFSSFNIIVIISSIDILLFAFEIAEIISIALKKNNTKLLDYIIENSELGPDNIKEMIERLKYRNVL